MTAKTSQLITALGVILVLVIALLLFGGANVLFPAATPANPATSTTGPSAPAVQSPNPTGPGSPPAPSPTTKPMQADVVLAYTNDTQGYLDPCSA